MTSIALEQLHKDIDEYLSTLPPMTINPANVQKRFEEKSYFDLPDMESVIDERVGMFMILKMRDGPKRDKGNEVILSESIKVPLSHPLIDFLSTGETRLLRRDVMERIWNYVKSNKLDNGPVVTCDEKLRKLFEVDFLMAHDIQRSLEAHFLKTEYQVYYETRSTPSL